MAAVSKCRCLGMLDCRCSCSPAIVASLPAVSLALCLPVATHLQAADRAVKRKQRPPQHEYIRHLVYERLPLGQVTKASGVGVGEGWSVQTRWCCLGGSCVELQGTHSVPACLPASPPACCPLTSQAVAMPTNAGAEEAAAAAVGRERALPAQDACAGQLQGALLSGAMGQLTTVKRNKLRPAWASVQDRAHPCACCSASECNRGLGFAACLPHPTTPTPGSPRPADPAHCQPGCWAGAVPPLPGCGPGGRGVGAGGGGAGGARCRNVLGKGGLVGCGLIVEVWLVGTACGTGEMDAGGVGSSVPEM